MKASRFIHSSPKKRNISDTCPLYSSFTPSAAYHQLSCKLPACLCTSNHDHTALSKPNLYNCQSRPSWVGSNSCWSWNQGARTTNCGLSSNIKRLQVHSCSKHASSTTAYSVSCDKVFYSNGDTGGENQELKQQYVHNTVILITQYLITEVVS